jgi:sulfotransferase family protein
MSRLGSAIDYRLNKYLPRPLYLFGRKRLYDARTVVRRNPGRGRLLPDFIVIGAAKSGTTSIYGSLCEHPYVAPCITDDPHFANSKEVHFFDYNFYRGKDWYKSHFPLERERAEFAREHGRPFITGEASPSYISHLWVPGRIRKMLPDVKLIAVLRNPVDRAFSQFQMSRNEGVEEIESFEEAIALEEERLRPELVRMAADPRYNSWNFGCWSYLARSRYAEQLERWLEVFPREQLLVLKAEDLFLEPQPVLDAVNEFLGLPPHAAPDARRLNPGRYAEDMPSETRAQLADYFRPHNERLYELTGIDFGWEAESTPVAV